MSVCLEHSTVLANPVGASASSSSESAINNTTPACGETEQPKNVTKLIVTNNSSTVVNSTTSVIPKLVSQPLITVLNSPGPLTVVKTLCGTSGVTSAPHFTLVNSTPLTVTNATGKSSTITLLNAPVALVKALPVASAEGREVATVATGNIITSNNGGDKPTAIHNVFVKNTCAPELVQENKFSTQTVVPCTAISPPVRTVNGQKPASGGNGNKVKILSNVVMSPAGAGPSNILLNKTNMQRYIPRQKVISNGATTTKYVGKPPLNNLVKTALPPVKMEKMMPQRPVYPTHKGQIKTMPPVNSYLQKSVAGIKTLPPQNKGMPTQVQRTNAGIRTIPPQRPSKPPNKPNYIGKHAVQAQKIKNSHNNNKMKTLKPPPSPNVASYHNRLPQNSAMNFNQALTAEIIQTLSHESGPSNSYSLSKTYDLPPSSQYDSPASAYLESREVMSSVIEEKPHHPSSGLNTLSLICHAVYLDHNYNATMPPDSPTRNSPPAANTSPQINGVPGNSLYSPGNSTKRLRPSPNSSSNIPPTVPTLTNNSLLTAGPPVHCLQDEDAASDVSCLSDRKVDTEGEETDTAPEAEAVNNDDQFDHYGDYVTRCICGFLHDDGYMIECDRCKVWQHVRCVVRNKQVPDEYLCEVCDPTKTVDRQKARLLQQQWMREAQIAVEAKLRKEGKLNNQMKHKEPLTESDSSDGENVAKSRLTSTARRKGDNQKHGSNNSRLRRDSTKDSGPKRPPKRKDRKVAKRKAKPQTKSQSDEDNNHDPWLNSQLPQLRQWIDNYEEAVTNHYSPELRARISSIRINGAHSDLSTQMEPGVQKCRIHMQPLTGLKYLVSTSFLPSNTPVVELRGKYMLSTQHRNSGNGGALTTRQHAQRPGPFLFFYRLNSRDNTEVCVDTRTYGNSARFVRRSCKPNAELRHCIEKGVLHLYIVTIAEVERNVELTIKHESHDLAAVGTTHIACACGTSDDCLMNKTGASSVKRNGEKAETSSNATNHRKRRSRRTNSTSGDQEVPQRTREATPPPPPPEQSPVVEIKQEEEIKPEPKLPEEEVKTEEVAVKEEVKDEIKKEEEVVPVEDEINVKKEKEEEEIKTEEKEREAKSPTPPPPPPPPVSTRRSSHRSSEPEDKKDPPPKDDKKNKKLSREERKIEAYMKAFERMEKLQQRRQEHQAKQAHRRESEPGPGKDEDKTESSKIKRRKRKGRARTASTNSQATRRNRLNSADSSYATSGDEQMLSPNNDNTSSRENLTTSKENSRDAETGSPDKAVGLLLSLANSDTVSRMEANNKTPPHDIDSNSNSAHSSPETPLSSACLLVAAAVGPLEPGFKFPKTKKGLMNEWLNKTDIQSASAISPSSLTPHIHTGSEYDTNTGFYAPSKNLSAISQGGTSGFCESPATVQPSGSAKKRWLRQAISEDQCDSPNSRPDSPPMSEAAAPPKKRRLPRESLSNNNSPPTTPTHTTAPALPDDVVVNKSGGGSEDGRVEIVYSGTEGDSPTQVLESDAVLKERAAEMQQEFAASLRLPEPPKMDHLIGTRFLMDPRLRRDAGLFTNSEHLVGTVEKTLSFLGYEDRKPESITPAKRKLSITEYRQRKKLNNNDKVLQGETIIEESNLSQSPKPIRRRSNSSSSVTSFASSDEETRASDLTDKAPAFNSEPTELERQRENVSLRLKKAFGLSVDDELRKPALNVESLLHCELPPVGKTTPLLPSPTFPIPGSSETLNKDSESVETEEEQPLLPPPSEVQDVEEEKAVEEANQAVLYYTPDEEELEHRELPDKNEAEKVDDVESSPNYVPPFNNPVYPNSLSTLDSVTDDEARYEGRNPSPPPELEVTIPDAGSYQVS